MFEQCTSLVMLILQLNAIIIMYELNMFEKKKWIQKQKFLKRRHLVRKPISVCVARGSNGELWNNVKKKISHTPGGKEIFGCRKAFFLKS